MKAIIKSLRRYTTYVVPLALDVMYISQNGVGTANKITDSKMIVFVSSNFCCA